jgi:hypothetical protein
MKEDIAHQHLKQIEQHNAVLATKNKSIIKPLQLNGCSQVQAHSDVARYVC